LRSSTPDAARRTAQAAQVHAKEVTAVLRKNLWSFSENRIAVRC
jgi:nuclear transport factor 2 (NTF2) superfamily protein